jgi:hypothetical protein
MSLIELVIYFALSIVAGVLLWSVNNLIWGGQRATESSYLVSGETETAIEWIRRDVSESALASIAVFPNAAKPDEAPGASLVSNRAFNPALKGKPLINRWGAPQWDKHVLYTLQRDSGGAVTGNLVRWEREIAVKNFLPVPCEVLPSSGGQQKQKVLLRDVLAPNATVAKASPEGDLHTDGFGGFRMQFVRRAGGSDGAESLTAENPRTGDAHGNTKMLEVEMKLLQMERSQPHYYDITFRVAAFH